MRLVGADNARVAGEAAGRVRFGVLGPLEVWRGGEPVRLGGERPRALLALLLVCANELVSVEVLVDALFGEQPSDGAVHAALAVYREISGLLRDELGLEPGRALRALERQVLQQDPRLTRSRSRSRRRPRRWEACRWRRQRSSGARELSELTAFCPEPMCGC